MQKWRKRTNVSDAPMGPKAIHSTVLTPEEEAMIVAFRRHTLLSLDDCLYGLQPTIPHLTRSALHRCLQRHGISRLPEVDGDKPARQKFKAYPIGFCGCRPECNRFDRMRVIECGLLSGLPMRHFQKPRASMVICGSGPNLLPELYCS